MVDEVPDSVVVNPGKQIQGIPLYFLKVDHHEVDGREVAVLVVPTWVPDRAEEMQLVPLHVFDCVHDPAGAQNEKVRVQEENKSSLDGLQTLLQSPGVVQATGVLSAYRLHALDDLDVGLLKRKVGAEFVVGQQPLMRCIGVELPSEVSIDFKVGPIFEKDRSDGDHEVLP